MDDNIILIIEESGTLARALALAIGDTASIETAESGKSGLEKALTLDPSLILLDLSLSDIDGFRVCEGLLKDERTEDIPVIVSVEVDEARPELKALSMGAADFVQKPWNQQILKARVKNQLAVMSAHKEIAQMAMTDSLTNCFNRRHFMNAADMEISRRKRHGHDLVVAILDVDFFKKVNDLYGHAVGDRVLREIADCCRDTVRYEDTVGRIGGEEFAILLPEANAEGAHTVLERLRENITAIEFDHRGKQFNVTVSIGITEVDYSDVAIDTALGRADQALYEAKTTGRDKAVIN